MDEALDESGTAADPSPDTEADSVCWADVPMARRPACAVVFALHERRVPHQPGDCLCLGRQGGPGGVKEGGAGETSGEPWGCAGCCEIDRAASWRALARLNWLQLP